MLFNENFRYVIQYCDVLACLKILMLFQILIYVIAAILILFVLLLLIVQECAVDSRSIIMYANALQVTVAPAAQVCQFC